MTPAEEFYLMRYLFASNRYEELWGYISQETDDSEVPLDVQLAAMKASFCFKNQSSGYFSQEGAEQLLSKEEIYLNELSNDNESEERKMLLLSRTLLQSCFGLTEDSDMELDPDILRSPSDIDYALIAVRLFNAGKYLEAIQACESFFQMNTGKTPPLQYRCPLQIIWNLRNSYRSGIMSNSCMCTHISNTPKKNILQTRSNGQLI